MLKRGWREWPVARRPSAGRTNQRKTADATRLRTSALASVALRRFVPRESAAPQAVRASTGFFVISFVLVVIIVIVVFAVG